METVSQMFDVSGSEKNGTASALRGMEPFACRHHRCREESGAHLEALTGSELLDWTEEGWRAVIDHWGGHQSLRESDQ